MAQIQALFNDRDRLVKRTTHLKKGVTIFGKDKQEEYDDEIYDDTDFYQALLKELITNGAIGSMFCFLFSSLDYHYYGDIVIYDLYCYFHCYHYYYLVIIVLSSTF